MNYSVKVRERNGYYVAQVRRNWEPIAESISPSRSLAVRGAVRDVREQRRFGELERPEFVADREVGHKAASVRAAEAVQLRMMGKGEP